MDKNAKVISLSEQEILRVEIIVIDSDRDDALAFLKELHLKIQKTTIRGLKSHLDV